MTFFFHLKFAEDLVHERGHATSRGAVGILEVLMDLCLERGLVVCGGARLRARHCKLRLWFSSDQTTVRMNIVEYKLPSYDVIVVIRILCMIHNLHLLNTGSTKQAGRVRYHTHTWTDPFVTARLLESTKSFGAASKEASRRWNHPSRRELSIGESFGVGLGSYYMISYFAAQQEHFDAG